MGITRRHLLELGALAALGAVGPLAGHGRSAEGLLTPLREAALPLGDPQWRSWAIGVLWKELRQAGPTPLIQLTPPFDPGIQLLVKNEARSVTGSLKHRAAWALLMWGLIGSRIRKDGHLYERTSGNTGIAEAYFARRLGLPFTAVTAASVSPLKLDAIRRQGGRVLAAAEGQSVKDFYRQVLAADPAAYDINQFANAERAIAYFEGTTAQSENLANELLLQLQARGLARPDWFVVGAGSGGTATSIGRYIRKWSPSAGEATTPKLMVMDPERSVILDWYLSGDTALRIEAASRIEGVGTSGPINFGQTFSLQREVVDRLLKVPDDLTLAGMHLLNNLVGFRVGPSSGLNLIGALRLACERKAAGLGGSIATLICDRGDRYADTYYSPAWVAAKGLNWQALAQPLARAWETGQWPDALRVGMSNGLKS
ncbi:MAG: PLP-dependent cysteine synthase family protein [Cyanobacteriota bacterium]